MEKAELAAMARDALHEAFVMHFKQLYQVLQTENNIERFKVGMRKLKRNHLVLVQMLEDWERSDGDS